MRQTLVVTSEVYMQIRSHTKVSPRTVCDPSLLSYALCVPQSHIQAQLAANILV